MQDPAARRLELMDWQTLRRAAARKGSTVLWPFGAIEQHGPHLPLATDAVFADRIADAVLDRLDGNLPIWRLPLQAIGFSPEHGGFPGTLSLPAEVMIALVVAVGRDLEAAGFQRLLLFNAHGGQIGLLEVAARQLRASHPALAVLPCFVWRGAEGIAALIPEPERSEGLHAGLAETSLMMHLEPGLISAEPVMDGPQQGMAPAGWSLEGSAPCAWLSREVTRSGVIGDPSGADPELGERLFLALVATWVQRLESLVLSDWPPTPERP
jgi:creatinine amidohydrolase